MPEAEVVGRRNGEAGEVKPDWSHLAKPATYRNSWRELAPALVRAYRPADEYLLDSAGIPTNVPMTTPSQARGHWRDKAKMAAAQRSKMRREVAKWLESNGPVLRITVTRVAPRRIDEPNLGAALKHAIDGLSDGLRLDDGSRAVEWVLKQRKGQAAVEWKIGAI